MAFRHSPCLMFCLDPRNGSNIGCSLVSLSLHDVHHSIERRFVDLSCLTPYRKLGRSLAINGSVFRTLEGFDVSSRSIRVNLILLTFQKDLRQSKFDSLIEDAYPSTSEATLQHGTRTATAFETLVRADECRRKEARPATSGTGSPSRSNDVIELGACTKYPDSTLSPSHPLRRKSSRREVALQDQ